MSINRHARTLKPLFETSLQKYADRTAVRLGEEVLTYRDLDERANAVAHGLVERGVKPQNRVALLMSNSLEYVVADLAIIKAGAAKLPLNDMLTPDEFEYMLADSRAGTVICGPDFVDTLADLDESLEHLGTRIGVRDGASLPDGFEAWDAIDGEETTPPDVVPEPGYISGHFYTGGTTGKPKGVLHTQDSMVMNQFAHIAELGVTGDETMLLMTPLPHSAGVFLWAGLLTGATAVIHPGFDPDVALDAIETHDVTWTFMVPTMIYRVLDHPELDDRDVTSLESLIYGAAPMTAARLREGLDELGAVFQQFYGQTEVPNLITTLGKTEHRQAVEQKHEEWLSSAGQPCLMADVKIVDPETGEDLPIGEEGEILATAPYVMEEYFQRPDATAETVTDSWVLTGDVGRIDERGYVYLLDRKSDMIITGGMNVYSTNVEAVLDEHPEVKEVAVIGVPDDDWGEAVMAVVVPHDEDAVTAADIQAFADERLADYKRPKQVEFVEEIPKTPYGKMDKNALREPYWEEQERAIG